MPERTVLDTNVLLHAISDVPADGAKQLAAAQAQGRDILYTEDMQDKRIVDRLRIVNPFR